MVRPERFELPTLWFEARCSIQLSYGRVVKPFKTDDFFPLALSRRENLTANLPLARTFDAFELGTRRRTDQDSTYLGG
jgi:hypothetical protein